MGDGTTSVVLLAGEFLKAAKPFVEEGVHPQVHNTCSHPAASATLFDPHGLHAQAVAQDVVVSLTFRVAQNIIRSYRQAGQQAVQKLKELSVDIGTDDKARQRDMMVKCAMTSMNSKLVSVQQVMS